VTLVRAPPSDRPVFDPYQRARLLLHRELTKEELAVEDRYNAKLKTEKHVTFDLPEEPESVVTASEVTAQAKERDPFRMEVLDLLGSIRSLVPEQPSRSPSTEPVLPSDATVGILPPKDKEELVEDPPLPAEEEPPAAQSARTVDQAQAASQPGLEEVPLPSPAPVQQESSLAAEPEILQSAPTKPVEGRRLLRSQTKGLLDTRITGAVLRDGVLEVQLLQRGQTRGRWIPFADVTDANKWDWLRTFYVEDSSQTLQYPPIRRAVQQMLASDRGSVNGGGGETLVNLGVPLGGECSDGAAEERRQYTGDKQEHQAVQPQSAWDSKSSVMMTPIRGMVYDGGFSEPFLGNTLNEKQ